VQVTVEKMATLLVNTLEKELGQKAINTVELQGEMLEFGVNAMRFVVDMQTLTVGRVFSEARPIVGTDNVSRIIQKRLRKIIKAELLAFAEFE